MSGTCEANEQFQIIRRLYDLRRDIVSSGYDEAIRYISAEFPVQIQNFKSGESRDGWPVPFGWEINKGFVESPDGDYLIDINKYPLSVGSYSVPVDTRLDKQDLLKHIVPNIRHDYEPNFLFDYYNREYKFSCGKSVYERIMNGQGSYRVLIESKFYKSELKVAEWHLPGDKKEEFVFSTHLCHPFQANDGLSGVATGLIIMKWLAGLSKRKYSYRLLIGPETIGTVCWINANKAALSNVFGGIFLEMTGLNQRSALQRSYMRNSIVDDLIVEIFREQDIRGWVADYRGVVGNDERQFNGPGVRVPMLSYSRALPWGHPDRPYKEYHSALDNLSIVQIDSLQNAFNIIQALISGMENNFYSMANYSGEAFLNGMGLALDRNKHLNAMRNKMKIMDMLDGNNGVHHISSKLKIPYTEVLTLLLQLEDKGAVSRVNSELMEYTTN